MNVLVVGGCGYIGSHVCQKLQATGHKVVVVDNLSTGHRASISGCEFVRANLSHPETLIALLRRHDIEAVMHFAALTSVPESVVEPLSYYLTNVGNTLNLLYAMELAPVSRFVFSSTAAVYGQAEQIPITEETPRDPCNPYGRTKFIVEQVLADLVHAHPKRFGYAALRYFNAAGAASDGSIGEDHSPETHLIPIVLEVARGSRQALTIHGTDYPTPDGTCIRDYVHVEDLADAHVRALERIQPGSALELNLGSGHGYSIQEVVETCRRVTGQPIPTVIGPRRAGDPAVLVASNALAREVLGWEPRHTLESIVQTAWRWHSTHPHGFSSTGKQ